MAKLVSFLIFFFSFSIMGWSESRPQATLTPTLAKSLVTRPGMAFDSWMTAFLPSKSAAERSGALV